MPGFEECRLCGDCCVGCIFLSYDEDGDLLGCLVYKNKYRRLVKGWHIAHHFKKGNQKSLDAFFNELMAIVEQENDRRDNRLGMCDSYQCWTISKSRKVMNSIRKDSAFRYLMLTEAKIQEIYRDLIPDFESLLEVLNS